METKMSEDRLKRTRREVHRYCNIVKDVPFIFLLSPKRDQTKVNNY